MGNATQIDAAILRAMTDRWKKVAMIVARVEEALRAGGVAVTYKEVADRIEGLAAAGQIEVAGDIKQWRHSEVRLPAD